MYVHIVLESKRTNAFQLDGNNVNFVYYGKTQMHHLTEHVYWRSMTKHQTTQGLRVLTKLMFAWSGISIFYSQEKLSMQWTTIVLSK